MANNPPRFRPHRTYPALVMLLVMAGVAWDEARQVAKEFADKPEPQPVKA